METIEIGGHSIEKGSIVMTGLASANHDPAKWGDDAEQIDVKRAGTAQHVSFGSGSHYCLGSSLARLEAQVAIGRFLRRCKLLVHIVAQRRRAPGFPCIGTLLLLR